MDAKTTQIIAALLTALRDSNALGSPESILYLATGLELEEWNDIKYALVERELISCDGYHWIKLLPKGEELAARVQATLDAARARGAAALEPRIPYKKSTELDFLTVTEKEIAVEIVTWIRENGNALYAVQLAVLLPKYAKQFRVRHGLEAIRDFIWWAVQHQIEPSRVIADIGHDMGAIEDDLMEPRTISYYGWRADQAQKEAQR